MIERWIRLGRWTLRGGLALFVVALATWTGMNCHGHRRLEGVLARLELEDVTLALSRLAPAAAADEENAAGLFHAAFGLYVRPRPEETAAAMQAQGQGWKSLSEEQRARLRPWFERNADCFRMFEYAAERPRCVFDRDWPSGIYMHLPELPKIRSLAGVLAVRAQAAVADGRPEEARRTVAALIGAADAFREEPILLTQMLRLLLLRSALAMIPDCIPPDAGTEEIEAWLQVIPPADAFDGAIALGLRGELATCAEMLPYGFDAILQGHGDVSREPVPAISLRGLLVALTRPIVKSDSADYLDVLHEFGGLAGRPYAETRAIVKERMAEIQSRLQGSWHPLTGLLLPAVPRALEQQARVCAHAAVLRAGLEAERARLRGGALAEPTAIDPFSGKPLILARDRGRIYSVGVNGADDGGAAGAANEDRDIVWVMRGGK